MNDAACNQGNMELLSTQIREGEGRIVRCTRCNLVKQELEWTVEEIAEYYNDEYQLTNSLVSGQVQTPRERFNDRLKTIYPFFELLKPLLKSNMAVLEVGCGAGELLSLIKPLVRECVGVEMNDAFVKFIQSDLNMEAFTGDVTQMDWGDRKFDLVICVDSLDHMANPLEVLTFMKGLLLPTGKMWVAVPNLDEVLNHYLPVPNQERYHTFFWHRAHFFYFNADTLAQMLRAAGMAVVNVEYYHQYTLKNFLKWFFTGLPQSSYVEAATGINYLVEKDTFAKEMNEMFINAEEKFQQLLREHGRGDTICCTAKLL